MWMQVETVQGCKELRASSQGWGWGWGGAGVPRWGRAWPQCQVHPSGAGLSPEFPEFGNQDSIERWKHPELGARRLQFWSELCWEHSV